MKNNKTNKEKLAERLYDSVKNSFDKSEFGQYYNNQLLPSLANYNRADTVNMNEEEILSSSLVWNSAITSPASILSPFFL